jgi:hypothetical protein
MRLYKSTVRFALAAVTTMALIGSASAADQVPLRGSLEGATYITVFPNFVTEATGTSSQLGQFDLSMPHVVDPVTRIAVGTFELVAANGDTIVGTMTGLAQLTETPDVLFIVENATITGGTGRFADATGSFTIERLYNRVLGDTAGSFEGTISSPGSGD